MTATHEARAPRHQDRASLWENSPELRESVKADLYEWGGAQRGGFPNIGYPQRNPYMTEDQSKTFRYDVDKVDAITDTFTLWRLGSNQAGPNEQKEVRRYIRILKRVFIGQGPVEAMARAEKVTPRHFRRLRNEAIRQFWVLHY